MIHDCPECGTDMEQYAPPYLFCRECDREYWREGTTWWYTDDQGTAQTVQ